MVSSDAGNRRGLALALSGNGKASIPGGAAVNVETLSVVFAHGAPAAPSRPTGDFNAALTDLHLDQVIAALVSKRPGYDIEHLFHEPARSVDEIKYRQEVARDLQSPRLRPGIDEFATKLRSARALLGSAAKFENVLFEQGWTLDAAQAYCEAISALAVALRDGDVMSEGLRSLRRYVDKYMLSEQFIYLSSGVSQLRGKLADIEYTTHLRGGRVTVDRYRGQPNYTTQVEEVFAKFRQGDVKDYRARFKDLRDTNHVQGWVLEQLARLYPDQFAALASFCSRIGQFIDPTLARFDTEAQFYLCYLDMVAELSRSGLGFCYPDVALSPPEVEVESGFDLALARLLANSGKPVVPNDVHLGPGERVIVVTGPNQAGKTTFARMFGQLHYLASLGLPVPGSSARLQLADNVFTHFEREESFDDLHGKLEEELFRVQRVLAKAGPASVVVMNESFSSTSLADNRFIGAQVLQALTNLGPLCVYVTFVDELSRLNEHVVSMVSEVTDGGPPATFRLRRRPADGRAYALALADRYGLTYSSLRHRLAPA